jgi:hypothetical protein
MAKTSVEFRMSKAGYFARPIEVDGKHHPQGARKEEQESSRWSDTVHKVADSIRSLLPSSDSSKESEPHRAA